MIRNPVLPTVIAGDTFGIILPHMSGLDFIEHQIQNGCKVDNIAVMSGYWTDQTLEKAIKSYIINSKKIANRIGKSGHTFCFIFGGTSAS